MARCSSSRVVVYYGISTETLKPVDRLFLIAGCGLVDLYNLVRSVRIERAHVMSSLFVRHRRGEAQAGQDGDHCVTSFTPRDADRYAGWTTHPLGRSERPDATSARRSAKDGSHGRRPTDCTTDASTRSTAVQISRCTGRSKILGCTERKVSRSTSPGKESHTSDAISGSHATSIRYRHTSTK